jgi:hypothetical protein
LGNQTIWKLLTRYFCISFQEPNLVMETFVFLFLELSTIKCISNINPKLVPKHFYYNLLEWSKKSNISNTKNFLVVDEGSV